jgi:hypothetical protein
MYQERDIAVPDTRQWRLGQAFDAYRVLSDRWLFNGRWRRCAPCSPIEIKGDAQASFDPPNGEAAPPVQPTVDDEIEYEWQRYIALDDQTCPTGGYVQDETFDGGIPK